MAGTGSATDMRVEVLGGAPPAPPRRPRVLLTGTVLAGSAAFVAITGLVAFYIRLREDFLGDPSIPGDASWLREAHVGLTPGNMGFITLLMSAVTAAAAGWSLRRGDRGHAMLSLGTTLLLGAAFITASAFTWEQLGVSVSDGGAVMDWVDGSPALLIVVITGAHVAMVAAGLLYLLAMGFRALGGQMTGRAAEGFNAAVVFWYMTIATFAVVWHTIYVTK